ncbi:hypothetical protein NKH16_31555, partial [Mesorhizobium sp. M1307]|uniref:hypothetical protein n=1 Tax=Mesorhizobium sp. M1307 TaxID=2957079 RepID=UPI00333DF08F
ISSAAGWFCRKISLAAAVVEADRDIPTVQRPNDEANQFLVGLPEPGKAFAQIGYDDGGRENVAGMIVGHDGMNGSVGVNTDS